MTRIDQKLLFSALGFVAVILTGDLGQQDGAKRARGLAWLIEEFCRTEVPEAFSENNQSASPIDDEEKRA